MNGHHLILGRLTDYLTGAAKDDTLDERYRQKLSRFLVETKGYDPSDLTADYRLTACAGGKSGTVPVDFLIRIDGVLGMVVKYGPGSMITRHRPARSIARLVDGRTVPFVVVTNGEAAHLLDASGNLLGQGFDAIPDKNQLIRQMAAKAMEMPSAEILEKDGRIVYAYEIDDSCPCDDTICRKTMGP